MHGLGALKGLSSWRRSWRVLCSLSDLKNIVRKHRFFLVSGEISLGPGHFIHEKNVTSTHFMDLYGQETCFPNITHIRNLRPRKSPTGDQLITNIAHIPGQRSKTSNIYVGGQSFTQSTTCSTRAPKQNLYIYILIYLENHDNIFCPYGFGHFFWSVTFFFQIWPCPTANPLLTGQ